VPAASAAAELAAAEARMAALSRPCSLAALGDAGGTGCSDACVSVSWQAAAYGEASSTVLPVPACPPSRAARPRTEAAASELRHTTLVVTPPPPQAGYRHHAPSAAIIERRADRDLPHLPRASYLELRTSQVAGAIGAGGMLRPTHKPPTAFRSRRRSADLYRSELEGEARHLPPDRPTRLSHLRERVKIVEVLGPPLEPFVSRTARAKFYDAGWLR